MSEFLFFAFGGHDDAVEGINGNIEVWDFSKIGKYDDFVKKIKEKMSIGQDVDFERCLLTRIKISELYEKCKWGVLLPWDREYCGEHPIADLFNLYSSVFLYPYFHVYKPGPFAFMHYNLGRSGRYFIETDQNQSQAFASEKFSQFFKKMYDATSYLESDRTKTCDWEYDDCGLYLSNGLYQDLKMYHSKIVDKADREYADITMVIELLLVSKDERDPGPTEEITKKLRDRSAAILPLKSKEVKSAIYKCANRRGAYIHGKFVQDILDVLKDECAEIKGNIHFDSAPSLRLVDFEFASKCTRYARFILVALPYLQTQYREWCKQHGGFAKIADAAISDEKLKSTMRGRVEEILPLLPDY